jgi:hypothetical protein
MTDYDWKGLVPNEHVQALRALVNWCKIQGMPGTELPQSTVVVVGLCNVTMGNNKKQLGKMVNLMNDMMGNNGACLLVCDNVMLPDGE